MIKFRYVEITGYGSIVGSLRYDFLPGLNIIKADNGFGKTTIFNAWFWGLTGETLKPKSTVNTWSHLQPSDYMGTKVVNHLTNAKDKYTIIRCSNYLGKVEGAKGGNRVIVLKNGKIEPLKGVKITQAYINNLLGYSPDLFKNTIVFGQKLKRLIDEQGTNKKGILEEAFDLFFIPQAQQKAQDKRKKLMELVSPLNLKVQKLKAEITGKRELLKQAKENEKSAKDEWQQEIVDYELEIKELEREIDLKRTLNSKTDIKDLKREIHFKETDLKKLQPSIDEYYKTMEEIARLSQSEIYLENTLKKVQKSLTKSQSQSQSKIEKCPTCGTNLEKLNQKQLKDHFKNELKINQKEYDDTLDKLNIKKGLIKEAKTQLTSLKEVINKSKYIETKIKELEKSLNSSTLGVSHVIQLENNLHKLKGKLQKVKDKKFQKKSPAIKLTIKKLKTELSELKPQYNSLSKDLEVTEWLIKDPLSNNGLKAYIFRDMVYKLNERMAYYSRFFGFRVEFEVDMDSHRKDINAFILQGNDNIIPYEDLSGGQAQFVAVIIAFSLHDIVSKGVRACNVLVMDEIFEGLSKNNIEKVSDIINSKMGDLSVNLITHRSEFNPYNGRIIKLGYDKGFTKLLQ